MATPPPPTRQQLDDLDALLKRMLALPVNPAEEPAPPDEPLPASRATPPLFPEPLTPPPGNVIVTDPLPPLPRKEEPKSAPSGPSIILAPASLPAGPVPLPLLNPVPPAERRAPVLPPPDRRLSPRQALIASRPPGPAVLLRPILWLNRGFDGLAFALGAPGRWLRRPAGRTLLGVAGLLLLAAALALLLLDRIGWTW
jgi:hypothetical protein